MYSIVLEIKFYSELWRGEHLWQSHVLLLTLLTKSNAKIKDRGHKTFIDLQMFDLSQV